MWSSNTRDILNNFQLKEKTNSQNNNKKLFQAVKLIAILAYCHGKNNSSYKRRK